MGSGALVVLINLAGGWWFIHRFILRPVDSLTAASARLAMGDLDTRVELDSKDEFAQLGNTFNNMAAHLQVKLRELREKEQFLQQLVDAIPDGVRIIDPEFRVLLTNRTCREQLGCRPEPETEVYCYRQAHDRDTPCPETLLTCPVQEINRKAEPLRVVHQHLTADGSRINVEIYSAPMHVTLEGQPRRLIVESMRDLEQEIKFSHEQKLSELGRLAAGVAHEIHNPLTSVRLALHAMKTETESEHANWEQIAEYLNLVDHEVDKCIEVTERLLRLSVPPPHLPELVCVDRVVNDTLKLLQWDAENQQVKIESDTAPSPLRILATDSELRMVILNLAQNALHAMPHGGSLRIESRRDHGWVEIKVNDTGVGIKVDDLQHIFEPFFSRRADGVQGTGLGLAITKAIVEKHNGTIELLSNAGRGSTFSLRFPDADLARED
jgi:signal transduction histidine kinase